MFKNTSIMITGGTGSFGKQFTKTLLNEYSPKKIKMSITGNGNSSKEQVAKMLQSILKFKKLPKKLDSTDGLAAAVCHFYNDKNIVGSEKYSGWNSFLKSNPDRLKN